VTRIKNNFAIRYSGKPPGTDCSCCGARGEAVTPGAVACTCQPYYATTVYCRTCNKCPQHCACTARIVKEN
jgi:hypothetical protein